MGDYTVRVSIGSEADTPEGAVREIVTWLSQNAARTVYKVINERTGESWLIDALTDLDGEE